MDQPARRVAYGSLNSECRCLTLVDTFRTGVPIEKGQAIIVDLWSCLECGHERVYGDRWGSKEGKADP